MKPTLILATLSLLCVSCASDGEDGCRPLRIAVLAAMPSELAPLVERARIDETIVIEGRTFRTGELGGVPVVLGMTRIGMQNATLTARSALQRFPVTGVVVSGVAGSQLRIADVAVPAQWLEPDGTAHAVDPQWRVLVEPLAQPGSLALEKCTAAPRSKPGEQLCLPFEPALVAGGVGRSGDSFGGQAYGCDADGGGVFGCDIEPKEALAGTGDPPPVPPGTARTPEGPLPYVKDMETSAIAREAAARRLPFLAFRAASDGSEDPLGLTEPFAQFFVYYDLAARNAAAATIAFLERLAAAQTCGSAL
jgi:adenosylhomocysteine nucleosidase